MTSEASRECYVYVMLPRATQFVTAGRLVVTTDAAGLPWGRFVYGASYLARKDAVAIDPVELRLQPGTFETRKLKGVFGALRDAGPDYWGRRVIEKHAGVPQLEEIDYLLQSSDDRAGALGFGLGKVPPAPLRKFNRTIDLEKLQDLADAVIGDSGPPGAGSHLPQVEDLLLVGTSMGGARPKTVVEDSEGLWLAKFNHPQDRWNFARVEHSMLELARRCGVRTARSRVVEVGDRDVLLVQRFDRRPTEGGYERARMISGLTLLGAEESSTDRRNWSYMILAENLRKVSALPSEDAAELFRRMCFNALISNTDDHPRNHALIAWGEDWRLSPAYDLTPAPLVASERRDLAMECGDRGRFANVANLLSQSRRFLLDPAEAGRIVDQMEAVVRESWYAMARAQGVTESDCKQIEGAFVYPGFRQPSS
jgi:serine/threonine-protein kinase HipA